MASSKTFVLKGNICYSVSPKEISTVSGGYLICENGMSLGVFTKVPQKYQNFPLIDYGDNIIIPGLSDLHVHAPQYAFQALGMDLELLDWLNTYTFPEEAKYADIKYADKKYSIFVNDLKKSATTRACVYATVHTDATVLLMEKLEQTGLVTVVGKVNMDRNCPDNLREESYQKAFENTKKWIEDTKDRFSNTSPVLTPRFIPTCSNELMIKLKELQVEYNLPVQSHLSENKAEIAWVMKLLPTVYTYAEAYNKFGMFGNPGTPTVMAHCVWTENSEEGLMKDNNVYVAHCPNSNINLLSGIAPIRRFINKGIKVGLATDVAGGFSLSIFRAMSDAVQVSKLYWRHINQDDSPLTVEEAFYLGTIGGGSFFGKVGSFDEGYELDCVVIDDDNLTAGNEFSLIERLTRIIYLSDDRNIKAKYVKGSEV